jgi:putative tryptophan/tyrosine transport system substrate-binding protein
MKRREFITLIGGAAAAWPVVAQAQQKERVRRIGILVPFPKSDARFQAYIREFRQALLRLGWSEGRNIQFDERWSTDNMDAVRADAAGLVELKPDVIFIAGDRVLTAFMKLTSTTPIVVGAVSDPIATGAVESLARPGHNVTGFSLLEFSMFGKMLAILKEIAPDISRVGMMHNPDNPVGVTYRLWFESNAGQLRVQPIDFPIHDAADIERAIAGIVERPDGGFLLPPDVTTSIHYKEVANLMARYRVPAIYSSPSFLEAGGLVTYGADISEMFRQAAGYVDRILRGEKPGDLPFQQPTTYRLRINLKTASAMGLTVRPALLARADEVIE